LSPPSARAPSIIAQHSFVLVVAKTGDGKTTLGVDLVFHGAAGREWCGLSFARPLRFLYVQNEGPREAFREKLENRLMEVSWSEVEPVRVWDDPTRWGLVKITDEQARLELRAAIVEHRIDFIVFDTATRSGAIGNGTPEDTRYFVEQLVELGVGRDVGAIVLHHPLTRPDPGLNLLEKIAGAWPPHADTILTLEKLPGNRGRLSFPKLRHARAERAPSIVAFDPTGQTYSWVADEHHDDDTVTPETYEQRVLDWLEQHPWATTTELDDGVEGRAEEVRFARQRLLGAGRVKTETPKERGRMGRFTHWHIAEPAPEADFHPSQLPGTGLDDEPDLPPNGRSSVHPSPRKRGRMSGTGLMERDDGASEVLA
jgi:AAA domain